MKNIFFSHYKEWYVITQSSNTLKKARKLWNTTLLLKIIDENQS